MSALSYEEGKRAETMENIIVYKSWEKANGYTIL